MKNEFDKIYFFLQSIKRDEFNVILTEKAKVILLGGSHDVSQTFLAF